MNIYALLDKLAVWALPLLLAIVIHEIGHGWVAHQLGDPTAKRLGRLTLNPIKHIDLVGTIALPLFMMTFTNFVFGWAKPVPITWQNLRHPRRDMALVALAGPFANLIMAILWALCFKLSLSFSGSGSNAVTWLHYTSQIGVLINIVLMVLNLMPIPPLDGSRVISSLIPPRWDYYYSQVEPYGFFILLGLIFTGILSSILRPLVYMVVNMIRALVGV